MAPFPVTVRYKFGEGGESKGATFYGLPLERSERAVLDRLREAHRFADWVEVVELRWDSGGRGRNPLHSAPRGHRLGYTTGHARVGCGRGGGMDDAVDAREGIVGRNGDGGAGWKPRRHPRCRMFKPALVVLADAMLDCVLLDLSPGGAQIYLLERAELPDRVTLWLPGGESRAVLRRWQRGSHIGFEAVGEAVPPS